MSSRPKSGNITPESLWTWTATPNGKPKRKRRGDKRFPVAEFLQDKHQQLQELVSGPGAGFGVGCGAGLGLGLVGGLGFDGSPWSHLKLVFGVGVGCGVGAGFGYGQGFGYGASLDSLSRDSKRSSKSERRIINL
ncbi:keratin, type II cytoskeletal 5 [Rhodamnia argentea]|uniref:Keratin, type II cytoskeletal 5 n=1 Tax=Rhodamnia argentea TaxID=178133 RepID=A0A8B8PPT4_9MYRT|nr:keratin, type II cytoskeletal 5 [Rhodamnia argentea]